MPSTARFVLCSRARIPGSRRWAAFAACAEHGNGGRSQVCVITVSHGWGSVHVHRRAFCVDLRCIFLAFPRRQRPIAKAPLRSPEAGRNDASVLGTARLPPGASRGGHARRLSPSFNLSKSLCRGTSAARRKCRHGFSSTKNPPRKSVPGGSGFVRRSASKQDFNTENTEGHGGPRSSDPAALRPKRHSGISVALRVKILLACQPHACRDPRSSAARHAPIWVQISGELY